MTLKEEGMWGILAKIALATYPIILLWGGWVTQETIENSAFRDAGRRYSASQALVADKKVSDAIIALNERITNEVKLLDARLDALPPRDWRQRILAIETNLHTINNRQVEILTKLNAVLSKQE